MKEGPVVRSLRGSLAGSYCQLLCFNNGSQVIRLPPHTLFTSSRTESHSPSIFQFTHLELKAENTWRPNSVIGVRYRRYLALAAGLSAPWTPVLRSEPDRRPGPGGSSGSGSEAPLVAGRVLQKEWEQRLKFKKNGAEWAEYLCNQDPLPEL